MIASFASLLIQAGESLAYVRDQVGASQHPSNGRCLCAPGAWGNMDAVDRLDDVDFIAPKGTLSIP